MRSILESSLIFCWKAILTWALGIFAWIRLSAWPWEQSEDLTEGNLLRVQMMGPYFLAALVGLALGSFLNVVISRLPQGEKVWVGGSRCDQCHTPIPWHDNIPLFSYFWLKGRCRFCSALIPWRYPAVEFTGGLLALALWVRFPGDPLLLAYGPFTAALVTLSVLDLEHRYIADIVTLPGIFLGLVLSFFLGHLLFLESALGALVGGGLFWGMGWGYEKLTSKTGIGGGDVKLMALIGAFLGVQSLPWVIISSAALGSLVGLGWAFWSGRWQKSQWRATSVPYAPFLAVAALLYIFGAPK